MTNAQKLAEAARIRNVRIRQRTAYVVLVTGLSVSTGANVMQSWGLGWIGWVLAGLAPVSLFGAMFLLELMGRDITKWKRIVVAVVLSAVALITAYVSYLHIYRLSYTTTHDVRISALVPFMIDLPMILASVLLSETRKSLGVTRVPVSAPVPSAKRTERATTIAAKPARTRTTKIAGATA